MSLGFTYTYASSERKGMHVPSIQQNAETRGIARLCVRMNNMRRETLCLRFSRPTLPQPFENRQEWRQHRGQRAKDGRRHFAAGQIVDVKTVGTRHADYTVANLDIEIGTGADRVI